MKWHQRFFWLLLLFLPTQLGYHFWPDWALVLGRRVDYFAPTVYLTDILLLALLGSWFFSRNSPFPPLKVRGGFRGVMLGFLLFVIFNVGQASSPIVALYKWFKVGEFILLGWYIVRTKPKLSTIITPLSIGVFYSSVLAIAQFFLQHSIGGPLWWLGERTFILDTPGIARIDWYGRELLRPYATFPHPNVLGGFLAAVLPLLIYNLQIYKSTNLQINGRIKKMYQWFLCVTFVVGIVALLLTFSRSAIVVGTIAIAIAIARNVEHKLRVVGTVLFVFVLTSYVLRLTSTEESVVVRQQLNVAAIKLWQSSPLFGVGLGNFLVRLPEALPTRTIYFLQPVHNIYLLLLSEVGVVGFLFLVWFLQKAFRHSFSIWHLAFGILLVLGLVDHYPLSLQQGQLLLTLLLGLAISEKTHSGFCVFL